MERHDVVIIGGGPSGFTAAIYLGRALLRPLMLTGVKKGGQLMNTTLVENFPGFPEGVMGPDLMMAMEEQAKKFGAEIRQVNVSKVEFADGIKKVWVGDEVIEAKTVIISTGASARTLGVGEEKFVGRGVSTCAVCDAAFFKGKTVVVAGGGDAAIEDAIALSKFTDKVSIVHRRDEFRASKIMVERLKSSPKIQIIWNTKVIGVMGEAKLEGVRLKDTKTDKEIEMPVDGLFLAIGHFPETGIFRDQVELDEKRFLTTSMTALMQGNKWRVSDKDIWLEGYPTMTSRDGVFGCGDVVDYRYKQAITAAGMGCQAALDVEKYLTGSVSSW